MPAKYENGFVRAFYITGGAFVAGREKGETHRGKAKRTKDKPKVTTPEQAQWQFLEKVHKLAPQGQRDQQPRLHGMAAAN